MKTKKMFFFKMVFTSAMLLLAMQFFISTKAWAVDTWSTVGTAEFSEPATMVKMAVDSHGVCYVAYDDASNGNKITVKKFNGTDWEIVGSPDFSVGQVYNLNMCIDSNDMVYIAYLDYGINYGAPIVKKFSSGTWQDLASNSIYSSNSMYISLAIDKNNVPYVLYNESSPSGYPACVKKYNGTKWEFVGAEGEISSSQICNVYMVINPKNNYPYVAYMDSNTSKGSVKLYNGSSWAYLGGKDGINCKAFYNSLAFDSSGTPYLAYADGDTGKGYVKKWSESTWASVGSGALSNQTGYAENIVFDSNDNLYLAYQNNSGQDFGYNAYGKPVVKKYDKASWSVVGEPGFSPIRIGDFNEAIRNDILYVAYTYDQYYSGSSKKITVKKLGSQVVPASGITATVASKTVPEANKVMLTVTPAAMDANHKVYYRVVDAVPSAPNVGDTITLSAWTEVTNTNANEITVADGKYIEAVEVATADSTVTKWGKSVATEDGYIAKAATPVANPKGGLIAPGTFIKLTSSNPGVIFHYTTDGSTPTVKGTTCQGTVGINTSTTLKVIAEVPGMAVSDVMTETYTVMEHVAAPTASPDGGGTVAKGTKVTLSTTTTGAAIYYTLDLKDPTISSNLYTGPITLNEPTTIKAMAAKDGMLNSYVVVENYYVPKDAPAAPIANPKGGSVSAGTKVTLSTTTEGAKIYYTTDGNSAILGGSEYTGPITVSKDMTIKAVAVSTGGQYSSEMTENYTTASVPSDTVATPTASPEGGCTVAQGTAVTLSTVTTGAAIYYTTDGNTPTTSSTLYENPIIVDSPTTIKAIAVKDGMVNSNILIANYGISETTSGVPVIVKQPESKQVSVGQSVSFSVSVTGDAPISYQWEKDGAAINNATGSAISLNNVQLSDAGIYSVIVSNDLGITTSSAVALIVNPIPSSNNSNDDSSSSSSNSTSNNTSNVSPSLTSTTVKGSVVEGSIGNQVSNVIATVTTEINGNKTVSMKTSDVAVFKQPDGSTCKFNDVSKVSISAGNGQAVTMASDGTVKVQNLAKGTDNSFNVTYDLGNGQKIVIGTVEVKVGNNGEVSLTSTLIDPYGVITDVTTGKPVQGATVTLYYANTDRNKANGKIADTMVKLPIINGFKPNDNKDPQMGDKSGTYGFMVFPTTDYYLVAEKDGYYKYVSPTISVEQEIVKWDFRMNPQGNSSKPTGVQRLAGQTRIDTALDIAKATYTGKISNVVLVASEDYADALSGSVLAYKSNAPMLLIGSSDEDQGKVLSYMKSNMDSTGNVYLLGGQGVLSKSFEDKVISAGFNNVTRLGGLDRYETSQKIAEKLNVNEGTPVIIASGENYPDALSVSSVAAVNQFPILLVKRNEIPDAIKKEISAIKPGKVYIIGLDGSISSALENNIPVEKANIVRIGGKDRFETSMEIAKYFKLTGNEGCIATGNDFADALVGSIYAAKYNAPIILIKEALSQDEILYLKDRKLNKAVVFGGEAVVNRNVEEQLSEIVGK